MDQEPVKAFYSRLYAVAKLVGFELDDDVLALYDRALEPIGYRALVIGLDRLAFDLGPGKPFPSIRAIQEAATGERQVEPAKLDDGAARLAASLIVEAVGRFGSHNGTSEAAIARLAAIRAHVGELGWSIVQRQGGWNSVCDMLTYDNIPILQAQYRELGKALLDRRAAGLGDDPPGLDDTARPRLVDSKGIAVVGAADVLASIPGAGMRRGK